MRKEFSLIELIVVISILGLLTAIITPNISNFKSKSIASHINSNKQTLQTVLDIYSLEHNDSYPVSIQPTLEKPEIIDVDLLYPKYIKSKLDLDKIKNQLYWVDVFGKVWGSTVEPPTEVYNINTKLEWKTTKDILGYNLYEVTESGLKSAVINKKIHLSKTLISPIDPGYIQAELPAETQYLISSIDKYGLETAPVEVNYKGQPSGNPLINKTGKFEFEINSEELLYWDEFEVIEEKPQGTNIKYEFSVTGDTETVGSLSNLNYGLKTNEFHSLPSSKNLKITINMIGSNGKSPSLSFMKVHYHYANEESVIKKPQLVFDRNSPSQYSENINEEGIVLDSDKPAKSVYQVKLQPNEGLDTITETHSTTTEVSTKTTLQYSTDGINFKPVESIPAIPKGSYVNVITETENGGTAKLTPPIIKITTEQPKVYPASDLEITLEELLGGKKPQKGNGEIPQNDLSNDPIINQEGWETVDILYFYAQGGSNSITHWISAEFQDTKPTNTRIEYRFGYSNGTGWTGGFDDISKIPDSRYLRVSAVLQVRKEVLESTTYPAVSSVRITHSKGVSDLSTVKPVAIIKPIKSNNETNSLFSTTTNTTWEYEAFDPKGKKIIKAEWSGTKQENYSISGTYTVKLRVLNESNYWSDWTDYTFEVKEEKPIAVIKLNPDSGIFTNTTIAWNASSSYDPDNDGISNVEWQGKQDKYTTAGTYTVKLRVQDAEGNWSDWTEKIFEVMDSMEIENITGGIYFTVALLKNGIVKTWGANDVGQMGTGPNTTLTYSKVSKTVPDLSNVKQIAVGNRHTLALLSDGTVMSWGENAAGQLGDGTTVNKFSPVAVQGLTNVVKVFANENTSFALLSDGSIYGWGNPSGNLFLNGDVNIRKTPYKVLSNSNISDLSVGLNHVMALQKDHTVMMWGSNTNSVFCIGNSSTLSSPITVPNLSNVTQVSAGRSYSMFLLEDGTVKTCGDNSLGQLGYESTGTVSIPTSVGIMNAIEIEAGDYNALALLSNGQVKSWGRNLNGEVGDGTKITKKTPVVVLNLTNVRMIGNGFANSYAVLQDGSVKAWGSNSSGQLGDGTSTHSQIPVNTIIQ